MKNVEFSNRSVILVLIIITSMIFVLLGFTFIIFDKSQNKNNKEKTNTELISFTYAKEFNGISLNNYVPLKDEDGKKLSEKAYYFDFSLKSKIDNKSKINYEIALSKSKGCNIEDKYIRVYLEKENDGTYIKYFDPKKFKGLTKNSKVGTPKNTMILLSDKAISNINDKYRLRVWLDEKAIITEIPVCNILVDIHAKIRK